ncbi:transcription factor Tfb2-domain-containing protein [Mycena sp. CBHHK59/15]|nr:transcription factor Tfb2-domain-containing protein [Mycena sp. CBHHK59/15]
MPSVTSNPQTENASSPHSLLPFLQSQSQTTLTRLYQRPSSCLSIFRLLAPLQQQIVMNLLWLESAIASSTMAAWVVREGKKNYDTALTTLFRLHFLATSPIKLALNPTFKTSFRQALTGGGTTGSFGVPAAKDDKYPPMDIDSLDGYALERWETILHYMVSSNSGQSSMRPSKDVLYLLQRSGLMASPHGSLQITSAGFQFLLHSPHAQLWDLLLQYLRMAEERGMDLVEVLSFLFMLSTMELGREYTTEGMNGAQTAALTQKAMLSDLRDYGLLWQRKSSSRRFYPTRLATTLTSSSPPLPTSTGTSSGPKEGFIVLETNYRIYAYTDNPLQTAVLNLFVALKYRFPNLVVGSITRDSVKKALSNGISAEQIISYLIAHAHPQMRKNNPLLPVTVQDQIRLWELEKNRLKSQEGYLYTAFTSPADYELVLNYAKQLDVVLWENAAKRCFFGSLDGHANIKGFIERRTGANA